MVTAVKVYDSFFVHNPYQVRRILLRRPISAGGHVQRRVIGGGVGVDIGCMVAAGPAPHLPFIFNVVIDAVGPVPVVPRIGIALLKVAHAGDIVARIVRSPHCVHKLNGKGVEAVRGNNIAEEGLARDGPRVRVHDGGPRIVNRPKASINVVGVGKVAASFRSRRHGRHKAPGCSHLPIFY